MLKVKTVDEIVGMPLREEQETSVVVDYEIKKAYVFSSKPSMIKAMKKWIQDHPKDIEIVSGDAYGQQIAVPTKWVKIKPPTTRSDEWRADAAARLIEARKKRKGAIKQ